MTEGSATARVSSLDELRRELEARGERIATAGAAVAVMASLEGHESLIQLAWRGTALQFNEIFPWVFAADQSHELMVTVSMANARLAMPAFQMRKVEDGWRAGYSTTAFLDHDGTISMHAVLAMLRGMRASIADGAVALRKLAKAPEPQAAPATPADAYSAAARRGAAKYAKLEPKVKFPEVTRDERAALGQAFARDLPSLASRVVAAQIWDVGGVFFEDVRVLRVDVAVPHPARTLSCYAALTLLGPFVLTANPVALSVMWSQERPKLAEASDPDLAFILANLVGMWTGASPMGELPITSVDEIPFVPGWDAAREAEVRRVFGPRIARPTLEISDVGLRVCTWLVSESRLRHRVVELPFSTRTPELAADPRAAIARATEEVLAELPVYPGRMWGDVGGRFVPTG